MKITVKDCYHLNNDFQNQFISSEVLPEPDYVKLKLAERTVHKVHYRDVYILEPKQYYKITFNENFKNIEELKCIVQINEALSKNGIIYSFCENILYLFNASDNQIFLRKGTILGRIVYG